MKLVLLLVVASTGAFGQQNFFNIPSAQKRARGVVFELNVFNL